MGGQPLPHPESGWYLLIVWPGWAWLAWIGYRGYRSGRMRWYASIDERRKDPLSYWANMAVWLVYFLCLGGAATVMTAQWIGRLS